MSQADFLKSKKKDLERQIEQMEGRRNDKQKEIARLDNDISEIERQLKSKREIQTRHRDEIEGFDKNLTRLRDDHTKTTNDLLEAERKSE